MIVSFTPLRGEQSPTWQSRIWIASLALAMTGLTGCSQSPSQATALKYGTTGGAGSAGVHTVLDGDTVYSISKAYQLPTRDIITLNHISPPYNLNVGYRVKLPAPREYRVRPGDTLFDIARAFDTTTSQIARLNYMSAPYRVQSGQTLRLPTPAQEEPVMQQAVYQPEVVQSVPVGRVEREVLTAPSSASPGVQPPMPTPHVNPPVASAPQVQNASVSAAAGLPTEVPPRTGNGKFMLPVDGKIISSYGPKADGLHNDGINIQAPKGTPVRAAENGVVVYAGNELKGYGNLVLIRHEDRWMTAYAHMDKFLVKKGETIRRGQSIGTVGSSGQVDTSQLHFEIRRGTEAKDPQVYL